ncbi:MAG: type II/IV secretion system ATPase subunit [Euryarchaeota archaeon]|nr:type II/IV secretion system ATPase subunit [Euryarchaeota archaeon]
MKIFNLIIDKKDNDTTLCKYRYRYTKNQRSISINCRDCPHSSSLNDDNCRRNIFRILLMEPSVERVTLSHLYERDIEGDSLALLYLLTRFQDHLSNYTDLAITHHKCGHDQATQFGQQIKDLIDQIIDVSQHDPVQACHMLLGLDIDSLSQHLKHPSNVGYGGGIDELRAVVDELKRLTFEIQHLCEYQDLDTSTFDYDRNIRSHVRPAFSTSRIYTEPPHNTRFLECYDISHHEGRELQVSIYELTDRPENLYIVTPMEYNLKMDELKQIERVREKMIRHRPENMNFADPANSREYFRRLAKKLLVEDADMHDLSLIPGQIKIFSDLLAKYTTGLGILEDILSDPDITDVYINAPADLNPVNVVRQGEECITNIYLSQDDLDSMVSRFRAISGRPFGEATPVLEMDLKEFGVRVSVIGDPLSANGLAYAFRKHANTPWTLPKLLNAGSISPFTAGLLSFLIDGQSSVLVAGDVGSGKTSLLTAMIMEIPQRYRILTIEDTREIPINELQRLGWKVQGMSARSSILSSNVEMKPDVALRAALRMGNSSLVIGEVRGPEVKVLYEAMQVGTAGNSVIGTIHGASTKAVYERIVHTLQVPPASFRSTDAVIICANTRSGGGMSKKRRVTEISEVSGNWDDNASVSEIFSDLLLYDATQDCHRPTNIMDRGQSELISKIAKKWGMTIEAASHNIRIRAKIKEKMAAYGRINPLLVEAEAVSAANNMFWLLMDTEKNMTDGTDYEHAYRQWCEWFEHYSAPYLNRSEE